MDKDMKTPAQREPRAPERRYSKSSAFYLNTKRDFFGNNAALLNKAEADNAFYARQPRRRCCKICESALPEEVDFRQHHVDYLFCHSCGHLNGAHEDTQAFIERLYINDAGREYSANYLDSNFARRVEDIYIPKVDFLLSNVARDNRLLDVGCGSGFFVYAAIKRGLSATGIDVGRTVIEYGNNQISHLSGLKPLTACEEGELFEAVRTTQATIVSAIGVIEHLREPQRFFRAFQESGARYLYYSVPMFSLSVILENAFAQVFPRQLSAGHTHLFTEASIEKMNSLINVRPVAEWRFGTDLMDLYRAIMTTASANRVSEQMLQHIASGLGSRVDEMQAILDRNHFCSEIHLLAERSAVDPIHPQS
jgi:Methyltransferase domain